MGGWDGNESSCNAGDLGLIPGSGRSPEEGNGYPLQYSCLENPMDWRAWRVNSPWSQQRVILPLKTKCLFCKPRKPKGKDWKQTLNTLDMGRMRSLLSESNRLWSLKMGSSRGSCGCCLFLLPVSNKAAVSSLCVCLGGSLAFSD